MANSIGTVYQDPNDTKKHTINWSPSLPSGVTIATATCPVTGGLTVSATSNDATTVTHTCSGGVQGRTYRLTSRVVLSDGQQLDEEFLVVVR